jgi:uncharacterized protein (DUF2164 family)
MSESHVTPVTNAKLAQEHSRVKVELFKQVRADAITSIQRYFQESMPEPIGNMAAGLLLSYFVEEIGPAIYNQAIADAQARIQQRMSDLEGDLYVPEFQYWPNLERNRKKER